MKLRNKKTGEIGNLEYHGLEDERIWVWIDNTSKPEYRYDSLTELNEEWEDYEEPKEYWFIDEFGMVQQEIDYYYDENKSAVHDKRLEVGNCFSSREEAEKAVEKLKAWKRLKDKGFRFNAVVDTFFCLDIFMKGESYEAIKDDLKIVFGGEE